MDVFEYGVASVNAAGVATSATLGSGVNAAFTSIQASVGSTKGVSILSVTNHTSNSRGFAGVFTQHNDIGRTGQNLSESILTPTNVNTASFGKLFSQSVDGYIYAQPLYVPNVTIAGGTHNVIYVATEGDSVYAFDADSNTGTNAGLLWHASVIDTAHGAAAGATTVNIQVKETCSRIVLIWCRRWGITSTPVIDPSSGTMYVEAKSEENGNYYSSATRDRYHHWRGKVAGTGCNHSDGTGERGRRFYGESGRTPSPKSRGLTLVKWDHLYWICVALRTSRHITAGCFAYDAATFTQTSLLITTPNGTQTSDLGGFWMGGTGVAADSNGNIFIASGNGDFDTVNVPAQELGDTIMKVFNLGNPTLSLLDYFTPYDQSLLDGGGSRCWIWRRNATSDQTGSVTHELVQAGKKRGQSTWSTGIR